MESEQPVTRLTLLRDIFDVDPIAVECARRCMLFKTSREEATTGLLIPRTHTTTVTHRRDKRLISCVEGIDGTVQWYRASPEYYDFCIKPIRDTFTEDELIAARVWKKSKGVRGRISARKVAFVKIPEYCSAAKLLESSMEMSQGMNNAVNA